MPHYVDHVPAHYSAMKYSNSTSQITSNGDALRVNGNAHVPTLDTPDIHVYPAAVSNSPQPVLSTFNPSSGAGGRVGASPPAHNHHSIHSEGALV